MAGLAADEDAPGEGRLLLRRAPAGKGTYTGKRLIETHVGQAEGSGGRVDPLPSKLLLFSTYS